MRRLVGVSATMSRPQWSESTNSFSEIPGAVQGFLVHFAAVVQQGRKRPDDDYGQSNPQTAEGNVSNGCIRNVKLPSVCVVSISVDRVRFEI